MVNFGAKWSILSIFASIGTSVALRNFVETLKILSKMYAKTRKRIICIKEHWPPTKVWVLRYWKESCGKLIE